METGAKPTTTIQQREIEATTITTAPVVIPNAAPEKVKEKPEILQYDRYGFIITPESQKIALALESTSRVRKENERLIKWQAMLLDFTTFRKKHAHKVSERVLKGIPDAVRGTAWIAFVGPVAEQMGLDMKKLLAEDISEDTRKQIARDLPRTMPTNELYRRLVPSDPLPPRCEALGRLLHSYAKYDEEVEYVQGMNTIAAVALLYMDEYSAFDIFLHVMVRLGYREYFLPGFPRLERSMTILEHLVSIHLPRLSHHLAKHNVSLRSLFPSWLMTMFTYNLPFAAVIRLWDWMLIAGHDVIFAFVLAVLKAVQEEALRQTNTSALTEFVMGFSRQLQLEPDFVVQHALQFKHVTIPKTLVTERRRSRATP